MDSGDQANSKLVFKCGEEREESRMRLLGLEFEQWDGMMLSAKKRKTGRGTELLSAMRERWEDWNRGSCFSYVRCEEPIRLLKLFTKSSQQYKDDQDRVPNFYEFISLREKKN